MDILDILTQDYQNFPYHQTYRIYAPDVYFKDPLNEFRGRDRYEKNDSIYHPLVSATSARFTSDSAQWEPNSHRLDLELDNTITLETSNSDSGLERAWIK